MKYNDRTKYFSCYSPNLKDYLIRNGFEFIYSFTHTRENKVCWVFNKTEELSVYLEQWTKNKKKYVIEYKNT